MWCLYVKACVCTIMFLRKKWSNTCLSSSSIKQMCTQTGCTNIPNSHMGISVCTHTTYTQPSPHISSSLCNTNSYSKAHSRHTQELCSSLSRTHTHTNSVAWLAREKMRIKKSNNGDGIRSPMAEGPESKC